MATSSSRSCRSSTCGALPLTPAPLPPMASPTGAPPPGRRLPGLNPRQRSSAATSWHHWLYWVALHDGDRVFGPKTFRRSFRIGERAAKIEIDLILDDGRLRRRDPVIGRPGLRDRSRLEVSLDGLEMRLELGVAVQQHIDADRAVEDRGRQLELVGQRGGHRVERGAHVVQATGRTDEAPVEHLPLVEHDRVGHRDHLTSCSGAAGRPAP